jgi:hypothetical protein
MPWGKDVPEEIFFNDVLPYASLDEARDPWRAKFYEMFRPLVADAPNATVALERIHARITPTLGVQYNTKRRAPNQGPFESMERKMATCTGLSILLTDVARAVCIPARIVGIAEWTTKQGNHNWNEVWLPERRAWVATEYDRDQHGLDRGWYLADAARAIPGSLWHGIYATSWASMSSSACPMAAMPVWPALSKCAKAISSSAKASARRRPTIGTNFLPSKSPKACATKSP